MTTTTVHSATMPAWDSHLRTASLSFCRMQYYEEIGKPTPKVEVMQYLKAKQYVDAKDFAGECEAVVVVAKGQGTCHAICPTGYRSSSQFRFATCTERKSETLLHCLGRKLARRAGDVQVRHEGGLHHGVA